MRQVSGECLTGDAASGWSSARSSLGTTPVVAVLLAAVLWTGNARAEDEAAAPPAAETAPGGDADLKEAGQGDGTSTAATDEGIGLTLQDRIKAVSRKTFLKDGRFELDVMPGITTNDAFFRRWTLGGRASFHFNDAFSVDVGGAYNIFSEELEPVRVLKQEELLVPDESALLGYVDGGVTFSPVYGKVALMSELIIHFDAFVTGGIGAVFDTGATPAHPAMEVGVGTRIFLLHWLVIRADLRDYIYPQDRLGLSTLQNLLFLNVGVGFFFPFDFEYKYEGAKVNG